MHINFKEYKQNSSFQFFFKEISYVKLIFFIEPKWLNLDCVFPYMPENLERIRVKSHIMRKVFRLYEEISVCSAIFEEVGPRVCVRPNPSEFVFLLKRAFSRQGYFF